MPLATGISSGTTRNTITDQKKPIPGQKEYHPRLEGIPSQVTRNSRLDRNTTPKYHPRPETEGKPSQTRMPPHVRRNTNPDQKKYHHRPKGIRSQVRMNTIPGQKEYHPRPEYHRIPLHRSDTEAEAAIGDRVACIL